MVDSRRFCLGNDNGARKKLTAQYYANHQEQYTETGYPKIVGCFIVNVVKSRYAK